MSKAVAAFPGVNPLAVMILYFLVPPIILAITIRLIWKNYHWRGGFFTKFVSNLGVVLNHHAPLITCANFFLACLLFLNQGSFVLNNYTTNSDVKFYLRVDRPEFTNYDVIFNAQALNSIRAIRLAAEENSITRRLLDHPEEEEIEADQTVSRNLATATTDGTEKILNLIYHRDDWSVVTSDEQLTNICLTERNIRANIPCLSSIYDFTFRSYIPLVFNPITCEYLDDYEQARSQIGYFPNEQYFSDRTMYSSDDSPIVISYMRMGTCRDVYSNEEFAVALNAQAVGGIEVTHASFAYLGDEFRDSTGSLKKVMIYSSLFAFLFLMFSVRGIIVALATMFCIALSMINAASLLDHYDYAFLSAFNAAALLVLLSVGAGWVHLYGSAWHHTVKRGKNASPVCLMHIFGTVGSGNFLTFLACCLAFFSLGASPVIFMSELGYFLGMAMLMFFFLFHYLIVPLWVWTSWYVIPSRYHNQFRLLRQKYCLICLTKTNTSAANEVVREHNRQEYHNEHRRSRVRHVLGQHGHMDDEDSGDDDHSDAEGGRSVSTVSVVAAVVPADQVRFATEGETKHDDGAMGTVTARAAMLDEDGNEIHEEGYHEEALDPAGGVIVAAPPAPEQDEENATQDGGDETRWLTWHRLCYNKGPVKVLGFLALLFTVFLILLSVLLTQQKMHTDFAYIQLIDGPSNLNTVMDVFEFYRGDVFYAVDDDNAARLIDPGTPTRAPTRVPTFKPTVFGNPTLAPTFKPTISSKPTALPTITPTSRPTLAPTGGPSGVPVSVYTDFRVTGCWGLHATKDSKDGAAQPNWDYYKFRAYMEDGFVSDMTDACDYVETHREYLEVHPDWNSTTDCLSEQYKKIRSNPAYPITMPVRDTLFIWGTTVATAPQLIGLYNNETEKKESIQPVWVCANFTGRTYMSSFHDDMSYGKELRNRWESVFTKYASKNAKKRDVSVVVSTVEFTYPLLGQYITEQVQFQAWVFFIGFGCLLLLFTWFDIGMTIFGLLGLFTIYAVTIFIGVYWISSMINLGDVVALITLLPFLVSFTIHLLTTYMANRHIHDKSEKEERAVQVHINTWFLSPAFLKTQRYMLKALLGPLGLALVAAAGFTYSKYPILRRFAYYYIICAIVAYLFCIFVQTWLLAFACRQRYCDLFDDEHEHHEFVPHTQTRNGERVISHEVHREQEVELQRHAAAHANTRRNLNHLQPHGSQFQMNSVYNNSSQFHMDNEYLAPNIVHTSYTVDNADHIPPPQEPLTYTEDIDYAPVPLAMPGYDENYNYDPTQVDYGYDAYGNPLPPPPMVGPAGRTQVLRPPMVIRHVHRVTSNQPILTVPGASQSFYQPDLGSAAPQAYYQPDQYYPQDGYPQPVQGGYYQDDGEDYGDDQSYVSGASRPQYNARSGGSVSSNSNAPSFYGNGRASRSQYIPVSPGQENGQSMYGRMNTSQYASPGQPAGYPRGAAPQSQYVAYDQQSQYDDSEYGQAPYAQQGYPPQQQYAAPQQQGYPPRQYNNNNQSQYYDQNNY
eukprot:CAMPEP_0184985522 /NCGR_PEP_ID=MMETSP1098-20130426/14155_1 /TAXON_ID=89044 /ORGANISM="Spumella elongata, Strain CCAP 955/1" /LENGTH=1517 /DNA_ID=CAMNT_0027509611 /DNA_START=44 /DNA_END=4597 /DNA_ORIENTATION=+